jgi:hypothetical protein
LIPALMQMVFEDVCYEGRISTVLPFCVREQYRAPHPVPLPRGEGERFQRRVIIVSAWFFKPCWRFFSPFGRGRGEGNCVLNFRCGGSPVRDERS